MAEREMIEIANAELSAAINPFGAELTHLRDAQGRELMTDADPAYWTGHAPILFPIVGALHDDTLRVDGRDYTMPKHGFARRSLFRVIDDRHPARVALALTDSEETRAQYPFAFALEVAFALERATLSVTATVRNTGDVELPASFGFHPAFAWPLPGADRGAHRITFAADEPGTLKEISPDGLILPDPRPSPLDGRVLALDDALFARDALVWDPVASQAVTYGADTGPSLRIEFPDTPRLGIWTKPGARFVCVEPWHGIADPQGYRGEFRDKPGVFTLAPGEAKRIAMSITLA